MRDGPFCLFWSTVVFTSELSHGCHLCLFLIIQSQTLTLTEKMRHAVLYCCSGFLDVSSMSPWSYFDRPGKVQLCFLYLWIVTLDVVFWTLKALEMTL